MHQMTSVFHDSPFQSFNLIELAESDIYKVIDEDVTCQRYKTDSQCSSMASHAAWEKLHL